jgi:hypothetical protein
MAHTVHTQTEWSFPPLAHIEQPGASAPSAARLVSQLPLPDSASLSPRTRSGAKAPALNVPREEPSPSLRSGGARRASTTGRAHENLARYSNGDDADGDGDGDGSDGEAGLVSPEYKAKRSRLPSDSAEQQQRPSHEVAGLDR